MNCRKHAPELVLALALLSARPIVTNADDKNPAPRGDISATQKEIEKQAKGMGPWDQHQPVIEDATDQVFEQQGWTSEPDRYARELIREVDRLPPWQQHERQIPPAGEHAFEIVGQLHCGAHQRVHTLEPTLLLRWRSR